MGLLGTGRHNDLSVISTNVVEQIARISYEKAPSGGARTRPPLFLEWNMQPSLLSLFQTTNLNLPMGRNGRHEECCRAVTTLVGMRSHGCTLSERLGARINLANSKPAKIGTYKQDLVNDLVSDK